MFRRPAGEPGGRSLELIRRQVTWEDDAPYPRTVCVRPTRRCCRLPLSSVPGRDREDSCGGGAEVGVSARAVCGGARTAYACGLGSLASGSTCPTGGGGSFRSGRVLSGRSAGRGALAPHAVDRELAHGVGIPTPVCKTTGGWVRKSLRAPTACRHPGNPAISTQERGPNRRHSYPDSRCSQLREARVRAPRRSTGHRSRRGEPTAPAAVKHPPQAPTVAPGGTDRHSNVILP